MTWFTKDINSKMSNNESLLPAYLGTSPGKTWFYWNWGKKTFFSQLIKTCWEQMAGWRADVRSLCQLGNEQHNLPSAIFLTSCVYYWVGAILHCGHILLIDLFLYLYWRMKNIIKCIVPIRLLKDLVGGRKVQ